MTTCTATAELWDGPILTTAIPVRTDTMHAPIIGAGDVAACAATPTITTPEDAAIAAMMERK